MRIIKIGRDESNDIVLNSPKVSSRHAELIMKDNGDIMLEDKGSTNGTFVQNNRISPKNAVSVKRGDMICFADVELQWRQVPLPEDNSDYKAIYSIGKNSDNDIQLSGDTVSRYHATVKVGKNGRAYIIDHSSNGTTVNGRKIPSNSPQEINKNSVVICGGVPLNLRNTPIQWPGAILKKLFAVVAGILILAGIGFGIWKILPSSSKTWTQKEISARYNSTTVMLMGMYHYEVECGDLSPEFLNSIGIPTKFYYVIDENTKKSVLLPMGHSTEVGSIKNKSTYEASGFFISKDGKILTNLHVAKPWLFGGELKEVEAYCRNLLAQKAEINTLNTVLANRGLGLGLSSYVSQLKVKGVSDGIMLLPQGAYYSVENAIMCHIVSAGDDTSVDVALIQCDKQELPNARCSYVNVTDSMDVTENATSVGDQIYTIGFPHGTTLQDVNSEHGLQAFCHGGHITMVNSDYNFNFDATSYHGASGSPIFNDKGFLIGILHSGVEKENFTEGLKAKYIKELLDSPKKK